ncbi:hypothetical protein [Aeromonas hydrophila]|uniref:hypothetical protein n=1 Tax=Aeromonas hydrophila TaxID=644 RepID=UPI000CB0B460|nr:hypothetical protein [Aeromonas hydrophila]PKD25072.1 T4-like virus tail tube protein gp19 [Aeromonas hydrophila]
MNILNSASSFISNKASGLADYAFDKAKSAADDALSGRNEADTPDFTRFMRVIEQRDLARTNLFLVRFQDMRNVLTADGIVGSAGKLFDKVGSANGITEKGKALFNGVANSANFNRIQDIAMDQIHKRLPQVANVVGAVDPTLVRMIPGAGELLDGFLDSAYDAKRDLALMVKSVNLPGTSFDTQRNVHNRKPFTEVRGRSYDTLRMTFYCTPGYAERQWFLKWMSDIHDPDSNTMSFYSQYARAIDVVCLDRTGDVRSVTHCDGCFPQRVSEVQLDFENNNQIATFEVEFALSTAKQSQQDGTGNIFKSAESIFNRGRAMIKAFK